MQYDINKNFSDATLQHASLSFPQSLEELQQANQRFRDRLKRGAKETLLLNAAVDTCLATRTAWLKAFPEWRQKGNGLLDQLAALKQALAESRELLASLLTETPETETLKREKLNRFYQNVQGREEMVSILTDVSKDRQTREDEVIELEGGKPAVLQT